MTRVDIINKLIEAKGLITYLEIGVRNPADCFNHIKAVYKTSVDPGYETPHHKYDYRMTSDEFFEQLNSGRLDIPKNYKWDIIFIDGLHLSLQVYCDVLNSLKHLSKRGYIVLHDCNPPTMHHAREDYKDFTTPAGVSWNGTVWKAVQLLRVLGKGIRTVDTDWGVGVMPQGAKAEMSNINPFYEYGVFNEHRKDILDLITPDEFIAWIAGENSTQGV